MKKTMVQMARFAVVGLANTLIGLGAIYGLMKAGIDPYLANAGGYAIGLMVSYVLNHAWTFQSHRRIGSSLVQYVLLAAIAYVCNLAAVHAMLTHTHINAYIAQLAGVICYTLMMFLGLKLIVFRVPPIISTTERSP